MKQPIALDPITEALYTDAEERANRFNLRCMGILFFCSLACLILNEVGIFTAEPVLLRVSALGGAGVALMPVARWFLHDRVFKRRPSVCRAKTEPSLSVAWTVDGVVTGYLLGCETGLRDFSLIAAWQAKPSTAFLHLLRTQLNLCFYRCSGNFRYYASPVTPRAERLLQRLTGGVYTRYEEHAAVLPLNRLR